MRRYLILGLFLVFSLSGTVLLVSVLQLFRMGYDDRYGIRRHRRRSLLSALRARFINHESLRRRSHAAL